MTRHRLSLAYLLSLTVSIFMIFSPVQADLASQADFNRNGEVDWPDFLAFAGAFNSIESKYDLNDNGSVDFGDFLLFASVFGQTLAVVFKEEEISYFLDIALGAEFGNANAVIRKWSQNLRIQVKGSPSGEDSAVLNQVKEEINELIQGVRLEFVEEDPNVESFLVPLHEFTQYLSTYVPGNIGFFWTWFNARQELYRATILIDRNQTSAIRAHLIREELTQSLGLMQDSWKYPSSIFYQGWSTQTQFSDIDRSVVRMLYLPELSAGMTTLQAENAVRGIDQITKPAGASQRGSAGGGSF